MSCDVSCQVTGTIRLSSLSLQARERDQQGERREEGGEGTPIMQKNEFSAKKQKGKK